VRFATAQDHIHRHKTTSVERGTVYLETGAQKGRGEI
jgi:hypothetical protein